MLLTIDEIRRRFGSPSLHNEEEMNEAHVSALSHIDFLTSNFADAATLTREACARVAEREAQAHGEEDGEIYIARKIATAIRSNEPIEQE